MNDNGLREELAAITTKENARVLLEVKEDRFLNGIAQYRLLAPKEQWPMLNVAALHGPAGDVVELFEPHTEADPVALLASFLAEVGAMLNRAPHLILDGTF